MSDRRALLSEESADDGLNGEELAGSLVERLVAYDEALALNSEASCGSEVSCRSGSDRLRDNLACIDLLHRLWPNEESWLPPGGDAECRPWRAPELAGFRIVREIGRGGMGLVYEAEEVVLGRRVALKLLPDSTLSDAQQRQRFQTEARAGATLRHPHIVPVYSFAEQGHTPYFAMQLIEGPSMSDVIARLQAAQPGLAPAAARTGVETAPRVDRATLGGDGSQVEGDVPRASLDSVATSVLDSLVYEYAQSRAMYFRTVARWGAQLADALAFAHGQGVVHRDIKPSNLLVDVDRKPWITDFGLARFMSEATMTRTGDVLGTLRFMAPEQALGQRAAVDPRADIYALGMTLYELLTLRPAFDAVDRRELLRQICSADASAPRSIDRSIPLDLEVIIRKAIDADPQGRYGSARGLADDLTRFLQHRPIAARPPGPWVRTLKWARRRPAIAVSLTLCFLALAGFWASSWSHARTLAKALRQSEHHRKRAEASSKQALDREQQLRSQQYAWRIKLANDALKSRNGEQFRRMLLYESQESEPTSFELRYLHKLLHSEKEVLTGHSQDVNCVDYSPDGKWLATASDDGTVKIWQNGTYQPVGTLTGHSSCVNEVSFAPEGTWLATASCDHTVKRWDAVTRRELASFPHDAPVWCLAISPDGATIATGTGDGIGGNAGRDLVTTWDVATGRRQWVSPGHKGDVSSMAYSIDGTTLATGSTDGTVRLWDGDSGIELQCFSGHNDQICCVRYSPNGKYLTSGSMNGSIMFWDQARSRPERVLRCDHGVFALAFSANSEHLATGTDDGFVAIWDMVTNEQVASRICDKDRITSLHYHDSDGTLAYSTKENTVGIWNIEEVPCRVARFGIPMGGSVSDVGLQQFYSVLGNGQITCHDLAGGKVSIVRPKAAKHVVNPAIRDRSAKIATSDDGSRLVVPSPIAGWELLELPSGRNLGTIADDRGRLVGFAFLHGDQSLLGIVQVDGPSPQWSASVWNAETLQLEYQLPVRESIPISVAVHPNGHEIAVCLGSALEVYELPSGKRVHAIEGQFRRFGGGSCQLCYFPDGRSLAISRLDKVPSILDVESGAERSLAVGSRDNVTCLAVSPDGQTVVSGEFPGRIKFWNVASGVEMLELRPEFPLVEHIQFSQDGKRLACWGISSGEQIEVTVWSVE